MKTINERANDLIKSIERDVRSDIIDEFIYKISLKRNPLIDDDKQIINADVLDEIIKIGDKMREDIPIQEIDTHFCTAKESDFKFQIKQKVFYVYKGWNQYYYCPAFILSRKEEIEHAYKDERHWRLDIDNTLSKTKQYNSYEIFARFDTKSDKVNVSEEELCATEKESIARVTELNKDSREYPELD